MFSTEAHKTENEVSKLLHAKGFTRADICKHLGNISYQTLRRWMLHPSKYMTLSDIAVVAGLLEMPLIYVIGLIWGMNRTGAKKWYEENKDALNTK